MGNRSKNRKKMITKQVRLSKKRERKRRIRAWIPQQSYNASHRHKVIRDHVVERFHYNLKNDQLHIIEAPKVFSIVDNPEKTLNFFKHMDEKIREGIPILMDLRNVKQITVDALLYILRLHDYFKYSLIPFSIKGNMPIDKKCKFLVEHSGILNYCHTKIENHSSMDNVLTIKNGMDVDASVTVKNVIDFVIEKLKIKKTRTIGTNETALTFQAIIEMMTNTVGHAYENKKCKTSRWYLIAWHDTHDNIIRLSFLDCGVGIPNNLNRTKYEKVCGLISKLGLTFVKDSFLVNSAFKGEFRTRTGKEYRGRGMPSIYKYSQLSNIKKFITISNKAHIDCKKNNLKDFDYAFKGTLYYWTFKA